MILVKIKVIETEDKLMRILPLINENQSLVLIFNTSLFI